MLFRWIVNTFLVYFVDTRVTLTEYTQTSRQRRHYDDQMIIKSLILILTLDFELLQFRIASTASMNISASSVVL